jgi:hypothetical protein
MGRNHIIHQAYIHDFIVLIEDKIPKIRENAYKAMLNLIDYQEG